MSKITVFFTGGTAGYHQVDIDTYRKLNAMPLAELANLICTQWKPEYLLTEIGRMIQQWEAAERTTRLTGFTLNSVVQNISTVLSNIYTAADRKMPFFKQYDGTTGKYGQGAIDHVQEVHVDGAYYKSEGWEPDLYRIKFVDCKIECDNNRATEKSQFFVGKNYQFERCMFIAVPRISMMVGTDFKFVACSAKDLNVTYRQNCSILWEGCTLIGGSHMTDKKYVSLVFAELTFSGGSVDDTKFCAVVPKFLNTVANIKLVVDNRLYKASQQDARVQKHKVICVDSSMVVAVDEETLGVTVVSNVSKNINHDMRPRLLFSGSGDTTMCAADLDGDFQISGRRRLLLDNISNSYISAPTRGDFDAEVPDIGRIAVGANTSGKIGGSDVLLWFCKYASSERRVEISTPIVKYLDDIADKQKRAETWVDMRSSSLPRLLKLMGCYIGYK